MKKRRTKPKLTSEDRMLWKRVAESTVPLSKQRAKHLEEEMKAFLGELAPKPNAEHPAPTTTSRPLKSEAYSPPQPRQPTTRKTGLSDSYSQEAHPIEERVAKNLAKGRQSIDSRIDLHGMTQDRARFALLDFLQMAQRADHRIVLVITGKGNEGQGVLRRNVPLWLEQSQFAACVNGYRTSHISHGGEGALYVRIRKPHKKGHRS